MLLNTGAGAYVYQPEFLLNTCCTSPVYDRPANSPLPCTTSNHCTCRFSTLSNYSAHTGISQLGC